jgi:two-component sensor histidine kinase
MRQTNIQRLSITFLFLFIALVSLPAGAQTNDYIITKNFYSVEDGLASREVFCGLQDDDGFMWFGTRNGLNRYDGKSFKLFTKQKDGLADNKIIQLSKDKANHLFIVYGNPGYARSAMRTEVFDLKTYKAKPLKEVFPNMPFKEEHVYWVANGGDDVCFLVSNPFQFWRLSNGKFELKCEMTKWNNIVAKPEHLLTVNGAYHTTTGFHCIFSRDDAVLFLGNEMPFYFVTGGRCMVEDSISEKGIIALTPGHEVIFNTKESYNYFKQDGSFEYNVPSFKPPFASPMGYVYFRRSNCPELLAYAETEGLRLYDFDQWYKLLEKNEMRISAGNALYGFYKDRQNNYWIFSSAGINKLKLKHNPFAHYFTKAQLHDDSDNQVRGIYGDEKGNVYANVWDKFYCYNGSQNKFYSTNGLGLLYAMRHYNTFVYTVAQYVYRFDELKNVFSEKLTYQINGDTWALDSLMPGYMLAGCTNSCYKLYVITNEAKELNYSSEKIPHVNFVYRFIKQKNKKIWAVAQNGLYLIDEKGEMILDYWGKEKNTNTSHQFPFEVIFDAFEGSDGIFWFATNGEGLYRWDRSKNDFRQFNITAGLPSDILYRIESDDYNNLWISTDNGLVRFNTKDFKTNTYTVSNGLSHNEFNRTSSFKAADGKMFFGGLDGVNAFYPGDFTSDSTTEFVPLHVISFNKFSGEENKLTDKTFELLSQNKIVLQPGDRFFNLEFQLLDFQEGKINYAYKIDGIDKEWNYINENSIRISGLPYGNYTLRVKGQAHNGQWSRQELKIPIHVLTPFYLQSWFILLSCVLVLMLVFFFFRWRTKQLLKTKIALEKTVSERTEQLKASLGEKEILLKEIHHRVKNNLQVINSMFELQFANVKDESAKAAALEGQNRVRSIALVHQQLYQSDDIGKLNFHDFTVDLQKQVASIFQHKSQVISLDIDMQKLQFDLDTAIPLGLIMNELLTNSYKYAFKNDREGKIKISLVRSNNKFILIFQDNGPGLPEGVTFIKPGSLGLQMINLLSKQLGGKASYEFNNGSVFKIEFIGMAERKKQIE